MAFYLNVNSIAQIPMNNVTISINYKHGTGDSDVRGLYTGTDVPASYQYSHLFDYPGEYYVESFLQNVVSNQTLTINMSVWDSLLDLDFMYTDNLGKYITNTTAEFNFTNVPNYGFMYSIDFGDGSKIENVSEDIMYKLYNLSTFNHVYTSANVYTVKWTAENGHYKKSESFSVKVQNKVPTEGFLLQPIGQKYPWINLQSQNISVNLTLNESVPLPTNATCVFDADDLTAKIGGIKYIKRFIEILHPYLFEGTFNSTLNCSNEVSQYTYQFQLSVAKFKASELTLVFEQLVPLNKSDTVVMDFHIDTGGYALIPLGVSLVWNFDLHNVQNLPSPSILSVTFDKTPYSKEYIARGDYFVQVDVHADTTNTYSNLTYPFRLGIMRFEYNGTIQFINTTLVQYTMKGILGNGTYILHYGDGTSDGICTNIDENLSCVLDHLCPTHGYKLVRAVGKNETFYEYDDVVITCDNPMDNLKSDIPSEVYKPTGKINAMLRITANDLYLPEINCTLSFGDPIDRETYYSTQNVTYEKPFSVAYTYLALGRHSINITCSNLINITFYTQFIKVLNEDFLFTGMFDRHYSQKLSPLMISSMLDTEIFSRLQILANASVKTHYNDWVVGNNVSVNEDNPNRQGLVLSKGLFENLDKELFKVELFVRFIETPESYLSEPTYIQIVSPPPHAMIVGDSMRHVKRENITVDAFSMSYDPVFPEAHNLSFSWMCKWCVNV